MNSDYFSGKKIWVTGHNGMVGSAIIRKLCSFSNVEILTVDKSVVDLESQEDTLAWVHTHRPDIIIHCAAKVGGIEANKNSPADFLSINLRIALNIIEAAVKFDVEKLVCLGSSCFYPKLSKQPISEEALLTGPLEPTNEAYALAKIATLKLCSYYREQYGRDFIGIVPTNLYGTGDNFNPNEGHVISALIHKFTYANANNVKQVDLWGSGKPLREFMHVDDAAEGILHLTKNYSLARHINLCGGETVSIARLASIIQGIVGYKGHVHFDLNKPDGMMKKSLDNTILSDFEWTPSIGLFDGLVRTIEEYKLRCR